MPEFIYIVTIDAPSLAAADKAARSALRPDSSRFEYPDGDNEDDLPFEWSAAVHRLDSTPIEGR